MSHNFKIENFAADYLDLSTDFRFIVSADGRFLDANEAFINLMQSSLDKIISSRVVDAIFDLDKERWLKDFEHLKAHKTPGITSLKYRANNETSCVLAVISKWHAAKQVMICKATDISKMERTRRFLEESEAVSRIGGWEVDPARRIIHWTPALHAIYETDPATYTPTYENGHRLYPPESFKIVTDNVTKLLTVGGEFDVVVSAITAKGNHRWLRMTGKSLCEGDQVTSIHGTVKDVTKHEQSERFFQTVVDSLPVALFAKDANNDFRYTLWNKHAEEIFGLVKEQVIGKNDFDLQAKEIADLIRKKDLDVFATNGGVDITEEPVASPKGALRWMRTMKVGLKNFGGDSNIILGMTQDVSLLREQRQHLQYEKEKFETIVNSIPIMLAKLDADGKIEWLNKAWQSAFPSAETDLAGRHFVDALVKSESDKAAMYADIRNPSDSWSDYEIVGPNKQRIDLSLRFVRLSQRYTIAIGRDITLKKRQQILIEEQQIKIISSAKMSSLGAMAGGIAHEINNPLAIILGKAFQLKEQILRGDVDQVKLLAGFEKIETTALRISKIVKGLKAFSRDVDADPLVAYPLGTILDDTLELCKEKFRNHNVQLSVSSLPDVLVKCRPTQVSQVILNLLNNSFDAIEHLIEKWVNIDVKVSEQNVRIVVQDSGNGIDPAIITRLMVPFFTTKDLGKGTGLGLSIAKGIIDQHKGRLFYDETQPKTTFVIELDRHFEAPIPVPAG